MKDLNPLNDRELAEIRERIYFFAYRKLRNIEAAKDIAQETLLALIEATGNHQDNKPKDLAAFAYGIFKNKVADHFKAKTKEEKILSEFKKTIPESANDPAANHLQEGELQQIANWVGRIAPLDRQILDLWYRQGYSLQEIAAALHLRPHYVSVRKFRAIEKIKKWMRQK